MLDKKIEDKRVGWMCELNVAHNSPIGAADCIPLVQEIAPIDATAGDTATQRIGDRIKPKRLSVRGVLAINRAGRTTTSPIYARVLILAQKDIKTGAQIAGGAVDVARLLKPSWNVPPGQQVAFTGQSAMDLVTPVNTEKFRVYYDKVFKLSASLDEAVEENPACCKIWKYTFKDLPASLTYDAGNGNWANNFAPFCAIGYAYPDGSVQDLVATRLQSSYLSELTYEDA